MDRQAKRELRCRHFVRVLQSASTSTKAQSQAHPDTGSVDLAEAEAADSASRDIDSMASDEDYAAFLDKANEEPWKGASKSKDESKGKGKGKGKIQLMAVDQGLKIPPALREATRDVVYVSEADEPFEGVVLTLKDGEGLPDEGTVLLNFLSPFLSFPFLPSTQTTKLTKPPTETFATLVQHPNPADADVDILDVGEWDPQGQYKGVVEVVRKETRGSDVRVYRISVEGARVEYFVVGVEGGKLVGVRALGVES